MHFRMLLYLVTCYLRVTVFVDTPVTRCIKDTCSNLSSLSNLQMETKLFDLVTATATLGKHVTKIKTCKNGWSNLSENLRIVTLKLLELLLLLLKKFGNARLGESD